MTLQVSVPVWAMYQMGTRVRKRGGSNWHGQVVGYYSTIQTPKGICVESDFETGSVQIYPQDALERWYEGSVRDGKTPHGL